MKKLLPLTLLALFAFPPLAVFAAGVVDPLGNYITDEDVDPLTKLKLADTPFEVCKNKAFIPARIYNEDKEYWQSAIDQCGKDIGLEVLPDDSLLTIRTILGKLDGGEKDQATAVDFLKQVGEIAKANIEHNVNVTERFEYCATNPKEKDCARDLAQLGKSIEKVRPSFRMALALSNYGGDLTRKKASLNGAREDINRDMGPASDKLVFESTPPNMLGDKHTGRMEPLNDDEMKTALEAYNKEEEEMRKEWDAKWEATKEKLEAAAKKHPNPVLAKGITDAQAHIGHYNSPDFITRQSVKRQEIFEQRREEVVAALAKAPILGYLSKDKAVEGCLDDSAKDHVESCHALAMAVKRLKENAAKELAKVDGMLNGKQTVSNMLGIMGYGPAVREVLGKNSNGYCKAATGLANLVQNRKDGWGYTVNVGMVAAFAAGTTGIGSIAARITGEAVVSAVIGGVVSGGATWYGSKKLDEWEVDAQEQKVMGHATEDDGKDVADIKDLTAAKAALADNIMLMPANFIGTGVVSTLVGSQAIAKLARMEANTALREALKMKGHSEESIHQIFKDLTGKNAAAARKAQLTLLNDVGMDSNSIDVIKKASTKGIISHLNQFAAAKAIREDIKNAPMAKRVIDILNEVNPAKINEGNRQQVLEATLAGAKFGINNPKYLAAKINDWEQGLDGLAATYRRAEAKLTSKEVKGIADEEARRHQAIRLALRDEIEENPELKALSKEKKDEMVEQMATCGVGDAKLMRIKK